MNNFAYLLAAASALCLPFFAVASFGQPMPVSSDTFCRRLCGSVAPPRGGLPSRTTNLLLCHNKIRIGLLLYSYVNVLIVNRILTLYCFAKLTYFSPLKYYLLRYFVYKKYLESGGSKFSFWLHIPVSESLDYFIKYGVRDD